MAWSFEGKAVVESLSGPPSSKVVQVKIIPAHRDSPGKFAFVFPGGTGMLISAKAATAFQEGHGIIIRTDWLYMVRLPRIVAPAGSSAS